jgi:hypothetical protein
VTPVHFQDTIISGGSGPGLVDAVSFRILVGETLPPPVDAATFLLRLAGADTIAPPSEALTLRFPAPGFADAVLAPADARSFVVRAWLSGSAGTGVTSPANADGQNNGAVATLQTAPAGTNPITMTSAVGAGVLAGLSVASAIYRGWFKSVNALTTSTGSIVMRSTSALFADITMFSNAALNTTVDRLNGSFVFDLVAAGVDSLAKIQSCQVLHKVQDAVAGTSPHVLTVDAGAIELAAAFT